MMWSRKKIEHNLLTFSKLFHPVWMSSSTPLDVGGCRMRSEFRNAFFEKKFNRNTRSSLSNQYSYINKKIRHQICEKHGYFFYWSLEIFKMQHYLFCLNSIIVNISLSPPDGCREARFHHVLPVSSKSLGGSARHFSFSFARCSPTLCLLFSPLTNFLWLDICLYYLGCKH